jgi:phosphoserine phosphatase RsbU/P
MGLPASNPLLVMTEGPTSLAIPLDHFPFTLGRLPDRDCVVQHQSVSRDHAIVVRENADCYVIDRGSRFGTFVNGEKVQRRLLRFGDTIQLGSLESPALRFGDGTSEAEKPPSILPDVKAIARPGSDFERLKWFLQAARRLNEFGAIDEILSSLLEITLQLTGVERGYVFLYDPNGVLKLAAGQSADGSVLHDDGTISRTAIQQAIQGASKFIVTDTLTAEAGLRSESIVAQSIRSVICIPLRRRSVEGNHRTGEASGVLYLDSRLHAGSMTSVEHELLETIANEAAALVENAYLVQSEVAARRYRAELAIASQIQRGLMKVQVPELTYAKLSACSVPCLEIGGDFYDAIEAHGCFYVIIADISGKGISAALLASTLQGMLYAQVMAGQPLTQIAAVANQYILAKEIDKYATMILTRITPAGEVEYLNCGHVKPLVVSGEQVTRLEANNLIVGLLPGVVYESEICQLRHGDRLLLVTDGVTEAENRAGDFLGEEQLEQLARLPAIEAILDRVQTYLDGVPNGDDCTIVEVRYDATA